MRKGSRRKRGVNKSNYDGTWHRQTDTQKDEKDDMKQKQMTPQPPTSDANGPNRKLRLC